MKTELSCENCGDGDQKNDHNCAEWNAAEMHCGDITDLVNNYEEGKGNEMTLKIFASFSQSIIHGWVTDNQTF